MPMLSVLSMQRCGPVWKPFARARLREAWSQASLATSVGGLGLRLAERHAPAAYIASLASTAAACLGLDSAYDLASHSSYHAAITAHNQAVLPPDHLRVPVPSSTRQRELSQALDRAVLSQLLEPVPGREAARAHTSASWRCRVRAPGSTRPLARCSGSMLLLAYSAS